MQWCRISRGFCSPGLVTSGRSLRGWTQRSWVSLSDVQGGGGKVHLNPHSLTSSQRPLVTSTSVTHFCQWHLHSHAWRSGSLCLLCHQKSGPKLIHLSRNIPSWYTYLGLTLMEPISKDKIFQFVHVIGYLPWWHCYDTCHIAFTLHVHDLTVMLRVEGEGSGS